MITPASAIADTISDRELNDRLGHHKILDALLRVLAKPAAPVDPSDNYRAADRGYEEQEQLGA